MRFVKIAILDMYDNHANEGMRCILQIIRTVRQQENTDVTFDIFNVRANNELPELDYDIYISTGGPGSPLPSGEAWEEPYFELIDQLFAWNHTNERKKYLFMICHSFQLVMRHLQLGEVSRRKSTSFGIFPVHKTDQGQLYHNLDPLPDPFYAVDSRDYQVTQPNLERIDQIGAEILCLEKDRPHVPLERAIMAVRFSDEIFGTQFHPEADGEGMLRYFLTDEKRNHIVLNYGQEKYDEMVAYLQDPDKIALTESVILPTFLRNALEDLAEVAEENVAHS
ncbi:GMP synthase-Glutamine amidotransferase domain-like protein [Fibrisoma limi BUZ 3]|uniref:GMP synthase-Glutamine amidotransferase domain-like protein n=1 Tax=Fibrisoma limi BUZ 3 TaxID=1185876 RepID=I2GD26_9BACT|nr:homoserine O-succinyltransferase [Fibrisoma limi]CCH51800.1 GMP synthase-Glutamine amidotransferase domain-like protein [Fibrisoma limi BUZ 3]